MVKLVPDTNVDFPAFFVRAPTKTAERRFVAEYVHDWVALQKARGARGCVYVDIDDTILNYQERAVHGFEHMLHMLRRVQRMYPIYVCTARPDDQHANVMELLHSPKIDLRIDPDHLFMLPSHLYDRSTRHVEEFKSGIYDKLVRRKGGVLVRCGDKLWDVAHLDSLEGDLRHVGDKDCHLSFHPRLGGTLSAKLPGAE